MIERYMTPEMKELWSEQRKFELWLEVELAALEAMVEHDLAPKEDLEALKSKLPLNLDPDRISAIEKETRHDVIAFLMHVEELAGSCARFLHYGMTSYDVVDTALALRLVEAGKLILKELDRVLSVLAERARQFVETPMVGRSHGIHAEPITFGVVLARWYAAFSRVKSRLAAAVEEVRVGKLSGAVGVYGVLPPEVERSALSKLGLSAEPAASQVVPRDRHAAFFAALALLGTVLEDVAINLRHLQRTEVAEVEEAFAAGQRGSSAMPHKKNPISAENLTGMARLLRSYLLAALENVPLWHERDISHSSVERIIAPDATTAAHYALRRLARLLEGLRVNQDSMLRNLELTGGLIFSEKVMLALVRKGLTRSEAYKLVQQAAMRSLEQKTRFFDELKTSQEIRRYLNEEELEACFDLKAHLKHVHTIVERVLEGKEE